MLHTDTKNNYESKGTAKRSAFLKYYFSEELGGKINPYFGNAYKSAKKVGYSETYATKILGKVSKQNNSAGAMIEKGRKSLAEALRGKELDTDWLANLVYRLGNKSDKRVIGGKLVDTGDPDTQGARIALDFIAKTQGMYESEIYDEYASYTNEQLIERILSKLRRKN